MAKLVATRFRIVRHANGRAMLTFGSPVKSVEIEVAAEALPEIAAKISETAQDHPSALPMQKLPHRDHTAEKPNVPSGAQYSFEVFPETGQVLAKFILPATATHPDAVFDLMIGLADVQSMIEQLAKAAALLKPPSSGTRQ